MVMMSWAMKRHITCIAAYRCQANTCNMTLFGKGWSLVNDVIVLRRSEYFRGCPLLSCGSPGPPGSEMKQRHDKPGEGFSALTPPGLAAPGVKGLMVERISLPVVAVAATSSSFKGWWLCSGFGQASGCPWGTIYKKKDGYNKL